MLSSIPDGMKSVFCAVHNTEEPQHSTHTARHDIESEWRGQGPCAAGNCHKSTLCDVHASTSIKDLSRNSLMDHI